MTSGMLFLLEGVEGERLDVRITSPGEVRDLLKANAREYRIDPPTFFFLWNMEEDKSIDEVIDHTMIITDIPDTLDPETFITIKPLPRNGFST